MAGKNYSRRWYATWTMVIGACSKIDASLMLASSATVLSVTSCTVLLTWLPVAIDRLHTRIVLASPSGLRTFAEDLVRRDRQVGLEPVLSSGIKYQPGVFDKDVERALDIYRAVAQHTAGPIVQHEGVCRPWRTTS